MIAVMEKNANKNRKTKLLHREKRERKGSGTINTGRICRIATVLQVFNYYFKN